MTVQEQVAEIQREQQYFDDAMEAHLEKVSRASSNMATLGTAAERRAMKQVQDRQVALGEDSAVAFARMDLDGGDSWYIGKTLIQDEDHNPLVISWKSDMASRYYQATAQDPRNVTRKRDFFTSGNQIESLDDIWLAELAEELESLEQNDVHVSDTLLESLTSTRNGTMQDIVRTIQASQDAVMRADKDSLLVVQGGPGTGKTAVALHRASWLLVKYRETLNPAQLLVVGPNPAFVRYIQDVLPGLGDDDVTQTSVQQMLSRDMRIRSQDSDRVAKIKGDARMADVIAEGLNDRIKLPSGMIRIRRRNSASTINVLPESVVDDIRRLRSEYYGVGREKLKQRLLERCAEQLDVSRGVNVENVLDPKSLEAEVSKMWPKVTAAQFVRELLGSKARLRRAGKDFLSEEEIDALYRPAADRITEEPWTLADLALIDEAVSNIDDREQSWGHIIVDEAQDLSPMQIFALRRRSSNGSMTVVGDVAQSTGPFARDNWSDVIEGLKSNMPVKQETLAHGYRVPREVYAVAEGLLPQVAPSVEAPEIVRSTGAEPELFDVAHTQVATEVAKVASHHSSKGRFVGVIAPSEWWDQIAEAFDEQDVQWTNASDGGLGRSINLVTPEASKGLEFDSVVLVAPQTILEQDNGARLLYIAITRTTSRLDVIAPSDEIPEVIREGFSTVKVIDEPISSDVESDAESDDVSSSAGSDGEFDDEPSADAEPAGEEPAAAEDEAPARAMPTPAMVGSQFSLGSTVASAPESEERQAQADREFSAVERELIVKNGEYLASILTSVYAPEMREAILDEARKHL